MTGVWVDTDLGFDDLWALLLLRHLGADIAGVSLVAGVATMERTIANARGFAGAFGFDAPLFTGAVRPLRRDRESAERILGPRGMQSRGRHLPEPDHASMPGDAVAALAAWLRAAPTGVPRPVLAIGPLTNIARLVQDRPEAARNITRLVWMGGSAGPGNHTPAAEFNALADPEAADCVARAGLPLDVVDLMICRKVTFAPADMRRTDPLTADLLGGYLDIALSRGRAGMAIYDPVAALALARPALFDFQSCRMRVTIEPGPRYGATEFEADPGSLTRRATGFDPDGEANEIRNLCLDVLRGEIADVS